MPKKNGPLESTKFPTLFMVATPIGNLGDLTPRALEALRTASVILSEDTRRTRALLTHFEISNRVERLDQNSSDADFQHWVEFLSNGSTAAGVPTIALVTDAGTPGVSDPGAKLVHFVRERMQDGGDGVARPIQIVPLPGASAVTALVSVMGFHEPEFSFLGFFPRKEGDRTRLFDEIDTFSTLSFGRGALIWFESPHRVREALIWISSRSPSAQLVVAKELTKTFEKIFTGKAREVSAEVAAHLDQEGEVGEWCFGLKPKSRQQVQSLQGAELGEGSASWRQALRCSLESGGKVATAAKVVAREYGIKRETVYAVAVSISEVLKKSEKNREGGD